MHMNHEKESERGSWQMLKNDSSHVLTVKELSDYLKVHPSTIYRQLKRGRLPAFKVGSDWRFNIESIDRWRLEQDTLNEM
jgi:excisionase family DNA binding protein